MAAMKGVFFFLILALSASAFAEVGRGWPEDQKACLSIEMERENPEAFACREIRDQLQIFAEAEEKAVRDSFQLGERCLVNSDCLFNEACVTGRCVRRSPIGACRNDLDCFASDRCVRGRCQRQPRSPLPGRCVTNLDCAPLERCRLGRCVRP